MTTHIQIEKIRVHGAHLDELQIRELKETVSRNLMKAIARPSSPIDKSSAHAPLLRRIGNEAAAAIQAQIGKQKKLNHSVSGGQQ